MRGSPFLRTLLLAGGLLLAGCVLWRLMRAPAPETHEHRPVAPHVGVGAHCGFELKLSRRAESVELKARDGRVLFHADRTAGPLIGMFTPDAVDPSVYVAIHWAEAGEGNRFAKLTLEPAGKSTRVRYFEAPGDVEDVWELTNE